MRLILAATVRTDDGFWWAGVKRVDRPYSRVPAVGESIRIGDENDALTWAVSHVVWNNNGVPTLTLSMNEDDINELGLGYDPEADQPTPNLAVQLFESRGFARLEGPWPSE